MIGVKKRAIGVIGMLGIMFQDVKLFVVFFQLRRREPKLNRIIGVNNNNLIVDGDRIDSMSISEFVSEREMVIIILNSISTMIE